MEYFYRSVMSYRPKSDIKLLRFELSVGYPIYKKDVQSNLFLDSIEAQRKEMNMVPNQIMIDMSKAYQLTPILFYQIR